MRKLRGAIVTAGRRVSVLPGEAWSRFQAGRVSLCSGLARGRVNREAETITDHVDRLRLTLPPKL